jgi:hypothetical protein
LIRGSFKDFVHGLKIVKDAVDEPLLFVRLVK